MSDFIKFSQAIHNRFQSYDNVELYRTSIDTQVLYEEYLKAFPAGTNPIFRTNTEHDCSCCRNFIKNLGTVVVLKDGVIYTIWEELGDLPYPYGEVATHLATFVKANATITGVYRTKERQYGHESNKETYEGKVIQWNHFYGYVGRKHYSASPEKDAGLINTLAGVFLRGLQSISRQSVDDVIELIEQNALYRGEEHLATVRAFKDLQTAYYVDMEGTFHWENVSKKGAGIRNTVIGTLLTDLSDGVPMETAVASFEKKVAPENYKRTTALITPSMITAALTKLRDLDLEDAVSRRFAKLSDVSINNVIWADNSAKAMMKDTLADALMQSTQVRTAPTATKATDITIADFMTTVVPTASAMAILMKNALSSNLVSLTAPVHADVKHLFQWSNNFAWSYNGNITDSIKEKVKRAGGNTNAQLRVSLAWFNGDDLDIHADTPHGHIYYGNKGGVLDVDMNAGGANNKIDPVENLSWKDPVNGQYRIIINQFNCRSTENVGFVLEVENAGTVTQYTYENRVVDNVTALAFTIKDGLITSLESSDALKSEAKSTTLWGMKTEAFVSVDTLMFSPNYWDENATGNKHWFFILKGCKNDEPTRGIYNEFLTQSLHEHRKVFEVLGSQTMCPVVDEQLSGVGFSSTRKDEVVIQVTTNTGSVRNYNIKF